MNFLIRKEVGRRQVSSNAWELKMLGAPINRSQHHFKVCEHFANLPAGKTWLCKGEWQSSHYRLWSHGVILYARSVSKSVQSAYAWKSHLFISYKSHHYIIHLLHRYNVQFYTWNITFIIRCAFQNTIRVHFSLCPAEGSLDLTLRLCCEVSGNTFRFENSFPWGGSYVTKSDCQFSFPENDT